MFVKILRRFSLSGTVGKSSHRRKEINPDLPIPTLTETDIEDYIEVLKKRYRKNIEQREDLSTLENLSYPGVLYVDKAPPT